MTTGSAWTVESYAPVPDSSGLWYNEIPNANATQQFQVYATCGTLTSGPCTYTGNGAINFCS